MDKMAVKINFRLADDAVVAHSLKEKLDHKPNIWLIGCFSRQVQMNNWSRVCLHSCCLTWQSWPSSSTSGYPNPQAWGKVARRLPDIKTNSHERWTPRQKRRRGGGNQSVERPIALPRQNTIKRVRKPAKTIQSARSQTSADLLTSEGGQRAVTGLLSEWAGLSSLEPESRVFLRAN